MAFTQESLVQLMRLVQLDVPAAAQPRLCRELGQVLEWIAKLQEPAVEAAVPPLQTMSEAPNRLRDDVPAPALPVQEALRNAPSRRGEYFEVPAFHQQAPAS